ncbi:MAG: DHH family phosphoesterase [Spirochaetota bacterium]
MAEVNDTIIDPDFQELIDKLGAVVKGKRELLIITHTHPDPDSIAAAAALRLLVKQQFGVNASIAYSGIIARAENRAMVNKLKIPLKQYNRIKRDRYDCLALVDSQPGAGNNVLTAESECDIVIDHHPRRTDTKGELVVIDPDIGATATILIRWLNAVQIDIPTDIATALAYAISSETQNMYREAAREDIKAYLSVYVRASIRKLSEIINAHLPHYYFKQLGNALNNAFIYGNIITAHLTAIWHPEIVSEMADFFLKHERIGAVLCTGCYKKQIILSIRTGSDRINAGDMIKQLPLNPDYVGGHDRTAGGFLSIEGLSDEEIAAEVRQLQNAFASLAGAEKPVWRPLLGN